MNKRRLEMNTFRNYGDWKELEHELVLIGLSGGEDKLRDEMMLVFTMARSASAHPTQ